MLLLMQEHSVHVRHTSASFVKLDVSFNTNRRILNDNRFQDEPLYSLLGTLLKNIIYLCVFAFIYIMHIYYKYIFIFMYSYFIFVLQLW